MKTPFCEFCIKTNFLCKNCEKRAKENEEEFKISKYLFEKFSDLNCELVSLARSNEFIILLMKGEVGKIIGRDGKEIKKMEKITNKKIKVIKIDSDRDKIVYDLIKPVNPLGINILYGEKEIIKVRIRKRDLEKLPFPISFIEKILSDTFNEETRIFLE